MTGRGGGGTLGRSEARGPDPRDQDRPSPTPVPSRTLPGRRQPPVQPHDRHPQADPRSSIPIVTHASRSRAATPSDPEARLPASEGAEDRELVAVVGVLCWSIDPGVFVPAAALDRCRRPHRSPPPPTHPADMARRRIRGSPPRRMATSTRSLTQHPGQPPARNTSDKSVTTLGTGGMVDQWMRPS